MGIGDRGFAAASIPAPHSVIAQAYAGQFIDAVRKAYPTRVYRNDLGTALGIEHLVNTAQVMRESLAVRAPAYEAFVQGWG